MERCDGGVLLFLCPSAITNPNANCDLVVFGFPDWTPRNRFPLVIYRHSKGEVMMKLDRIRAKIAAGYYRLPHVLETVADRMLKQAEER